MYYLNRTSKVMAGPFERSSQAVIKVASIVLATNGLSALCAIVSYNFTPAATAKVESEALTRGQFPFASSPPFSSEFFTEPTGTSLCN